VRRSLQVVDVVGGGAAAQQDDGHAARVASQALAALVPAWRAAGRPDAELVAAVAAGLPAAAPHRRRPLVSAVVDALPQASRNCLCYDCRSRYHGCCRVAWYEVFQCDFRG